MDLLANSELLTGVTCICMWISEDNLDSPPSPHTPQTPHIKSVGFFRLRRRCEVLVLHTLAVWRGEDILIKQLVSISPDQIIPQTIGL